MGRVFTPDAVERRLVNNAHDVYITKYLAHRFLLEAYKNGGVYGAVFYGSTAYGGVSRRSDVDVYVVTTDACFVQPIREGLDELAVQTGVPIESGSIVCLQHARQGWTSLDRGLYAHIGRSQKSRHMVGQDPLKPTSLLGHPLGNDLHDYLAHKRRNFGDIGRPPELQIQRALEAPISIGRRLIETLIRLEELPSDALSNDSKLNVRQVIEDRHILTAKAYRAWRILVELDLYYDDILEATLRGENTNYRDVYNQLLQEAPPVAISFVDGIVTKFCEEVEGKVWKISRRVE